MIKLLTNSDKYRAVHPKHPCQRLDSVNRAKCGNSSKNKLTEFLLSICVRIWYILIGPFQPELLFSARFIVFERSFGHPHQASAFFT